MFDYSHSHDCTHSTMCSDKEVDELSQKVFFDSISINSKIIWEKYNKKYQWVFINQMSIIKQSC